jgi:hypothetical protein
MSFSSERTSFDGSETGSSATIVPVKTPSPDTSAEAHRKVVEACRRMTPTERIRRMQDLNRAVYALAEARIREWYGEVSDDEMKLRLAALRLDRTTMIRLYGWDPREKGY